MIILCLLDKGRSVQDVRRCGRQHQGHVPADGKVGGAQQVDGPRLQVCRAKIQKQRKTKTIVVDYPA